MIYTWTLPLAQTVASDGKAINERIWKDEEGRGRDLIYPGIWVEGLRKITKNLSQYSRDLNPWSPEYESGVTHLTVVFDYMGQYLLDSKIIL
jgi:hypothetical protein